MPERWDNIVILRTIDRLQEQVGGAPAWNNGVQIAQEAAGESFVSDDWLPGFIQELHIAHQVGLLTFGLMRSIAPPNPTSQPRYYLENLKDFSLTPAGQDRARNRIVVVDPPDPDEDDGRAISSLIVAQVGSAIESEYNAEQRETFLLEAGLPLEYLAVDRSPDDIGWVHAVLVALGGWGSEGRRHLRRFIGQWLDDRLIIGPDNELRTDLVEKLARQGWQVVDGNLVISEPAAGARVSSPILRDARVAALHPLVVEAAEKFVLTEHYDTAIFEVVKAIINRVKEISGLPDEGVPLMHKAFSEKDPVLLLADLSTATGSDVQEGFRFLFAGTVEAIRNPPAHDPFKDIGVNEALEYLGLLSLLMRKLDQAVVASA